MKTVRCITWNPRNNAKDNIEDDEGEDGLFLDDEFDIIEEDTADQTINAEGMMDINSTKDRLQKKAQERLAKLRGLNKSEMGADEFKERLDVPAYLRKDVRLQNVPHSSEPHVSKYNLNDDNQILGNNKFLHDNVDWPNGGQSDFLVSWYAYLIETDWHYQRLKPAYIPSFVVVVGCNFLAGAVVPIFFQ